MKKLWTEKEIAEVRRRYPDEVTAAIAKDLGRPISGVYGIASKLGLKKSQAFLSSPASGRTDGTIGKAGRFKKGLVPWNKGMKGLQIGGEKTRFKPGNRPHTWVPIGSYRITKDSLLQRKIADVPGPNHRRWRSVHELVWIEHNGPIPKGHIVRFLPGMQTTVLEEITIKKLECISRAENMRRNSFHNYGKDIAQLVQLRGAITRQINKREKRNEK